MWDELDILGAFGIEVVKELDLQVVKATLVTQVARELDLQVVKVI